MEIKGKDKEISYEELYKKYQELQIKYNNQALELNNLKRVIFGVKSEIMSKEEIIENGIQKSLFNAEENIAEQINEKTGEITVEYKRKAKNRKAGIKKEMLDNIEHEIVECKLDESETCPNCNGELEKVTTKVVRQEIEYIPAKLKIVNYVQEIYKCTECGTKESENESATFVKTQLPKPLLSNSFISPSLVTEVIYKKYFMGVPLYRQEKVWDDMGLILPRNMMANWIIKVTEYYLVYLYILMLKKLKSENELLHCDETEMQCNKEPGRKASAKSYMWILRSGELEKHKGAVFKYTQSRSAETAKEFLEGFDGLLITDGYAGYNSIPDVVHSECWAHCRRYFYESVPLDSNNEMDTSTDGYIGLEYCNKLFKIEREIAELKVFEKEEIRQKQSKPVLDEFFEWVNATSKKLIVNSKLKKALTYATNQQKELSEFLNDGRIPLSNNLVERSIRPFAIHRRNWLFADSVDGAKANSVIYSLIESAKINNLNIAKYIDFLLTEIPQLDNPNDFTILEKYLPWSKELPKKILNCQSTDDADISKVV